MYSEMEMIKCAIVRGGTSKAVFVMKNDLPTNPIHRDSLIRELFGSPDLRQIDGLGGGDVLTSKLAIISQSSREDADVDYTFAQVGIDTELVNFNGSCGNIASAVGAFAIDEGMIEAKEPITVVRVHLTNNDTVLIEEVPVHKGKSRISGDYHIDGCPGTGAKITLDWSSVVAQKPDCILPTKNTSDIIHVEGKNYTVTITGIGNYVAFIQASSLNLKGTESPNAIIENSQLMSLVEKIRGEVSVRLGLVERACDAQAITPYQPFLAIVTKPSNYIDSTGKEVKAPDVDIVSRLIFMQRVHKAYPISAATGIGAAARIPGTIIWNLMSDKSHDKINIAIGHPSGIMDIESVATSLEGHMIFDRLAIFRTSRRLMEGYGLVRKKNY